MTYSEAKAKYAGKGLHETRLFNALLWLFRDDVTQVDEAEVDRVVAAYQSPKPRSPRPTDGLRLLTTPDEDFGTSRGR